MIHSAAFGDSALEWDLGSGVVIRPLQSDDAAPMYALIAANRAHLDRWLRWSSGIQTLADASAMIATFTAKRAAADGFHSGTWVDGTLAGGVVCWYVHPQNRNAEIGYWLSEARVGRGLATRAARRACAHLFGSAGVHRIEMQCGVDNAASRAIPERLGFQCEGVRRESHWITTAFRDHAMYGLLAPEWKASAAG